MKAAGPRGDWLSLLVVAVAIAVGVYLRASEVGAHFLYGDEHHSLRLVSRGYAEILTTYDRVGSGLALPLLQRILADLLGERSFVWQLPALLGGVGTLLLAFPVARRAFGSAPAAVATLWIALSPILIYYAHFARAYSLMVFAALWLAWCLGRAAEGGASTSPAWIGAFLGFALLPWIHFVSLSAVVAAAAATAVVLVARSRPRALAPLALALSLAALLCLLLYLPAWDSFLGFLHHKAGWGRGKIGIFDVAEILAGDRMVGAFGLVALPLCAAGAVWRRGLSAVLAASLAAVPAALLLVANPTGGPFAYSRYLLASLPFAIMLLAWGVVASTEALLGRVLKGGAAMRRAFALLVGVATVMTSFALSPLAPWLERDGPFGHTYSLVRRLPVFDEPFRETPIYYAGLGSDPDVTRLIEAPEVKQRGVLVYRNYYLQHRKPTILAASLDPVELCELEASAGDGRSVVILHHGLRREADAYWEQIYPNGKLRGVPKGERAFMRGFRGSRLPRKLPRLRRALRDLKEAWGGPVYRDSFIAVWNLDPQTCK